MLIQRQYPTRFMIAVVAATALLVSLLLLVDRCGLFSDWPEAYRGDGEMSEGGFWTHPRYRISVPAILLSESGDHSYALKELPTADYMFGIEVLEVSQDGKELPLSDFENVSQGLPTSIAVKMTDAQGHVVYDRVALLRQWQLSMNVNDTTLWLDGYDIPLQCGHAYQLSVSFSPDIASGLRIVVQPFLAGGGNELP